MEMSKDDAKKFFESIEVQRHIDYYVENAFDHILVHFINNNELGYLRVGSPEEADELCFSDFFELYYTNDDNFIKLYRKPNIYGDASLSKHFRSAIVLIVVGAVEDYLGVEENYLWENESNLFEECLKIAGGKYFNLMSYNEMYTIKRDFPDRLYNVIKLFNL